MSAFETPRLLADIGATYARFAIERAPREFDAIASLRIADFPDLHATVSAYLAQHEHVGAKLIEHAAMAVANPVDGDFVRLTNAPWQFSIEEERTKLGLKTLVVVNDFTALAMAVPGLQSDEIRQVGGGAVKDGSVIGVIGAGSGLGVSGVIPAEHGWVALGTEGGHTSFSPRNEREVAILEYAWKMFTHVSFERVLSGRGIELMYAALAAHRKQTLTEPKPEAQEIAKRALAGTDALAVETMEVFCEILGTAAANLAVTLGAKAGIYVGGAIVPRLGDFFVNSRFRQRFEDKGRFSDYLKDVPTFVIHAEQATFRGVAAVLDAQPIGRRAARMLHGDGGDPARGEPLGDGVEVARIGPEPPDVGRPAPVAGRRRNARGRDADHVHVGVDVDPGRVGPEDGQRRCGVARRSGRRGGLGPGGRPPVTVVSAHGVGYPLGKKADVSREGT